ncbi:MAG: hypothetical protein HW421_2275 [Ignavibacteria bacterium]|nr:hypothetical protein [Ignavibacteria bacterium]
MIAALKQQIKREQLISTSEIFSCILTGADKILLDGSVVNGFPSLEVAKLNQKKIPFYVIGESFKYSSSQSIEDGFDIIPAEFITKIFSDEIFPEFQ